MDIFYNWLVCLNFLQELRLNQNNLNQSLFI